MANGTEGDEAEPAEPTLGTPVPLQHAGVRYPPPLIYLGGFAAGLVLERFMPLAKPAPGAASVAGFVLVVLAMMLSAASIGRFRRAGTSPVPNRPAEVLVTSGPYRFSRNPIYLSLGLAYVGAALILRTAWALVLLPAVMIYIDRYVVRKEERYLLSAFREEYRRYQASVRRWL